MTNKNREHDLEKLVNSIAENAFEFLEKSLDEFDSSPKFSIIHFASAIELFLKARLMKEHWSLILDKVDTADIGKLFSGEAKTVTPETARKRLKNIALDPIPSDTEATFREIAEHRNRAIHFGFHDENLTSGENSEKDDIVIQQCGGWWHLQGLFECEWKNCFSEFSQRIAGIELKMQCHRQYLETKFKSKEKLLKEHTDNGGEIRDCASCGFKSITVDHVDGAISSANCVVCNFHGTVIELECPSEDCSQKITFDSYSGPPDSCTSCRSPFEEWVKEGLDSEGPVTSDNYLDYFNINCSNCFDGYHSVVRHNSHYICTSCFEYSEVVGQCDWCNDGQLGGVSEYSYHSGCSFCDGKASWEKDD